MQYQEIEQESGQLFGKALPRLKLKLEALALRLIQRFDQRKLMVDLIDQGPQVPAASTDSTSKRWHKCANRTAPRLPLLPLKLWAMRANALASSRALRSASTRFCESSRKVSSNLGYSPSMTSCKPDNTSGSR